MTSPKGEASVNPIRVGGDNLNKQEGDLYDEGPSLADLVVRLVFSAMRQRVSMASGADIRCIDKRLVLLYGLGPVCHAKMNAAGLRAILLRASREGLLG